VFSKGLGNLGNLADMVKQALTMKGRIEELKEQLAHETVEASAGGGMVNIAMNGRMEVLSVSIDPDVIDNQEREVLETLVRAAVNEAVRKTQERVKEKMREITGGLDIPGLS